MATARLLREHRYRVRVLLAGALSRLREEPARYAGMLRHLRVPVRICRTPESIRRAARWFDGADLIVDALLGIGTKGRVREPLATLIRQINAASVPVVAVDVPSGLDGDCGTPQGVAVKATTTVTFGCVKRGCLIAQGPAHTGSLTLDPITIPRELLEHAAR